MGTIIPRPLGRCCKFQNCDGFRFETNITETDWYAPALGCAARMESNSSYMHPERCGDQLSVCTPIRGDWYVIELVEADTAKS